MEVWRHLANQIASDSAKVTAGTHRPWIYFRGKCATQHLSNSKKT